MTQSITHSILLIDDELNMLDMLSAFLRREGYQITTAVDGRQGLEYAVAESYDFTLCDVKMPVMDGLQFLEEIKARKIDSTIIMMSAFATVDTAVQAMKIGAYDFITKPFKLDEVVCILEKAAERVQLKKENLQLRQKVRTLEGNIRFAAIVGSSQALQNVLNLGRWESGTGKDLVAKGIHHLSSRGEGPFVSVNCGAIPANLLESEFFGYMKGAFTGADSDHKGLFEAASGGTLLLDEIGELPLELQVKLLRVLQEREVRPVGANSNRKINVRVLAATAKNLNDEVMQGHFRQDLLYRLNVVELKIPALRERPGDIPLLVHSFIETESSKMDIRIKGVTHGALALLSSYPWPGNVRELKNVMEHAIIFAENGWISSESLPEQISKAECMHHENLLPDTFSIKEGKVFVESYLIAKALTKTNGNKSQAAELLDISYPSLLNKIKEYNLHLVGKESGEGCE